MAAALPALATTGTGGLERAVRIFHRRFAKRHVVQAKGGMVPSKVSRKSKSYTLSKGDWLTSGETPICEAAPV